MKSNNTPRVINISKTNTPQVYTLILTAITLLTGISYSWANNHNPPLYNEDVPKNVHQSDTVPNNFLKPYLNNERKRNPYDLRSPSIIQNEVEYNPEDNNYIFKDRLGRDYLNSPRSMSFSEYMDYKAEQQKQQYYDVLSGRQNRRYLGLSSEPLNLKEPSVNLIETLFGSDKLSFNPKGRVDLALGYQHRKTDNPTLTRRQAVNGNLDFDMQFQLGLDAQVGEKLNIGINYNPRSTFDFDRVIKVSYDSKNFNEFGDDDIIKGIEAGNVSMPLNNSLIQGSESLFGLKLTTQFGKLRLTSLIAQQQTDSRSADLVGGALEYEFEISAEDYDVNRHFFLAHYFRDIFDTSLIALPQILSQVRITQLEVWVSNDGNNVTQSRRILALADLSEPLEENITDEKSVMPATVKRDDRGFALPFNDANTLYNDFAGSPQIKTGDDLSTLIQSLGVTNNSSRDYDARKLRSNEYTFNADLGFVSLRRRLEHDQTLSVAFEYEYRGTKYQVGELSVDVPIGSDGNNTSSNVRLITKMLRNNSNDPGKKYWDLMMKNFYHLQAYNLSQEDFVLDIFYDQPGELPSRYIPPQFIAPGNEFREIPILSLLRADRVNRTGDPQPDGEFDWVNGLTINPSTGIIMIPVLEPFGNYLTQFGYLDTIAYDELYASSPTRASQSTNRSRFIIKGEYKSSNGNIIPLNGFNVPQGSVRVTAGGRRLIEGTDYRVDYGAGYVEILNEAYLGPGTPINVGYEDQSAFGLNRKTMLGLRADYEIDRNFNIGATIMNLYERPYTQKVDIGNDPINNWMYGLDLNLTREAPFLTRWLKEVPLLRTNGESRIDFRAEGALLRPGHSRAINNADNGGIVMIDDFEASSFGADIRAAVYDWQLAALPSGNPKLFKGDINTIEAGYNRASLSWYNLETAQYERLRSDDPLLNNPYTRLVRVQDVFPNRDLDVTRTNFLRTMDVHFDPTKRGPYNFDPIGGSNISEGTNPNTQTNEIELKEPTTRWAGFQKRMRTNDFEEANYESLEFWMLDPFLEVPESGGMDQNTTGGKIYINLGIISEDILPDGLQSFENGLPSASDPGRATTSTVWGAVPDGPNITRTWDANTESRVIQDVGYDGLDDDKEKVFYKAYLDNLGDNSSIVMDDPANDNYYSYNAPEFAETATNPIIRYERYNYPDGNSEITTGDLPLAATNIPDNEDMNNDNSIRKFNEEAYLEYEIDLRPGIGNEDIQNKFIVDKVENTLPNGTVERWYLFRVPLNEPDTSVGDIGERLRYVEAMRMYMTDFAQPVTLRFASMEFIRNAWLQYSDPLALNSGDCAASTDDDHILNVSSINIEENGRKTPFNYVLPPGIQREQIPGAANVVQQNEQSLQLNFSDLSVKRGLGIFKNLGTLDLRNFERLKLYVHLEDTAVDRMKSTLQNGDISVFIRIGDDLNTNFYEIEQPLYPSSLDSLEGIERGNPIYKDIVWPAENYVDVPLAAFTNLKKKREITHGALNNLDDFGFDTIQVGNTNNKALVKVVGNPSLGSPKTIMIGLYNTTCNEVLGGEAWINELSLCGINEQGGAAATGSLDIQLADFGRITVSGNYSSIGFGNISDKVAFRAQEEIVEYNINTNFELGNFFPEQWGVQIPFSYQYTNSKSTPKFDALYEDLEIEEAYEIADNDTVLTREEVDARSNTTLTRKSMGFNNVNINPQSDKPPLPWSASNFRISYERAETKISDPNIEKDVTKEHRGGLDYDYSISANYVQPFKNVAPESKYLKFINEFNFNPLPTSFNFSTQLNRKHNSRKYRNTPDNSQNTWVTKTFRWDRSYNLNWDFTRSLKFRFNASNEAVIDELNENPENFDPEFVFDADANRDMIRDGLRSFGRNKNYGHTADLNYTLPFKHFPYLDFIDARATLSATYNWSAAPDYSLSQLQAFGDLLNIGNTIQNSQERRLSVGLKFDRLYKNIGYLNRIEGWKKPNPNDDNRKSRRTKEDEEDKSPQISSLEYALIRPLLMFRDLDYNYTKTYSSTIPGYFGETNLFGLSNGWDYPGWKYVLGFQPDEELYLDLNEQGLLRNAQFVNQELTRSEREGHDFQLSLEPFKNLKITLDAFKNYTQNEFEGFDTTLRGNDIFYTPWSPRSQGSIEVSIVSYRTLLGHDLNDIFDDFKRNRPIIHNRLNEDFGFKDDSLSYTGFDNNKKDVLIPSFIAAYLGRNASNLDLETYGVNFPVSAKGFFDLIPKPNWNLNFTGLQQIPFFEEHLQSLTIKHGYRSRMTVNSYDSDRDFNSYNRDSLATNLSPSSNSFYSQYNIPTIVIDESFNPLIGISLQTKSRMSINVDYVRNRRLSLSLENYRLSETTESRINFDFGYTISDVFIAFLQSSKKRALRDRQKREQERRSSRNPADNPREAADRERTENLGSDLTISLGFSYSDRGNFIHLLDQNAVALPSRQGGSPQKSYTFTPTANYKINQNLSVRLYGSYNRIIYQVTDGANLRVNYDFGVGMQYVLN